MPPAFATARLVASLRVACLVVAALSIPATAWAQKLLLGQGTTALYDVGTGQVEWTQPFRLATSGVFTSDGRYALAVSFDATLGAVRVIDAVDGSWFDLPISFEPRIAHPRATVVYGLTGGPLSFGFMTRGTLARLGLNGLSTYGGCAAGTATAIDLSGDGRLLFSACESGDIAVLDAESGAVLRMLPIGQGVTLASNFDGSAVVVARQGFGGAVELIDSTTGAILGSTVAPNSVPCWPAVARASPDRTRMVISCTSPSAPVPVSLSHILVMPGLTWGATLVGSSLRVASVSPDNSVTFSSYMHRTGLFGNVQINDLTSGAVTLSAPILASIAVSYPPLAPTLGATVAGRRVDLSWTLPPASPAATGHVLEIGSAPGLSDLGTVSLGVETTLTVPAAPPGRYYVRIRAGNASGRSAPSVEIAVDVT